MNNFSQLDGRHKLAILAAIAAWGVSIYFSQVGFSLQDHKAEWLGWFLGCLVTVVELAFNTRTNKLSLTLVVLGIVCYLYGIWTNVTGFWSFQNPDTAFAATSQSSIMSWFVGLILEILPEPLFMWGIDAEFEGDWLGNLIGLWTGRLTHAVPLPNGFKPKQNNNQSNKQNQPYPRPAPKPTPASASRPLYSEPTYHSVGNHTPQEDKLIGKARREFLEKIRAEKQRSDKEKTEPRFFGE